MKLSAPISLTVLDSIHNDSCFPKMATGNSGDGKLAEFLCWIALEKCASNHARDPARAPGYLQLLLVLLLVFFPVFALAQGVADLAISFEYLPAQAVRVGEIIETRVIITNLGTAPADAAVFLDLNFVDPQIAVRDEFNAVETIAAICPQDFFCSSCVRTGIIVPGQSRYCYSRLRAIQKRLAPNRSRFVAVSFDTVDPNPNNNAGIVELSIIGEIQAPLSPLSFFAMAGLILGIGAFAARPAD